MNQQPENGQDASADVPDDETLAERARALAAPIRWKVLRACLDESLTNKELSDRLGVNPGSMLHHVRTLVSVGFLAPEEVRRGARNAVEIPYRTTRLARHTAEGTASLGRLLGEAADD